MNRQLFSLFLMISTFNSIYTMEELDENVLKAYVEQKGLEQVQNALNQNTTASASASFTICWMSASENPDYLGDKKELSKAFAPHLNKISGKEHYTWHAITPKTMCSSLPTISGFSYAFKTTYNQTDLNQLYQEKP